MKYSIMAMASLLFSGYQALATLGQLSYPNSSYVIDLSVSVNDVPVVTGVSTSNLECKATGLPSGFAINGATCALTYTGSIGNILAKSAPLTYAIDVTSPFVSGTTVVKVQFLAHTPMYGQNEGCFNYLNQEIDCPSTPYTFQVTNQFSWVPSFDGKSETFSGCRATGLPAGLAISPSTCEITGIAEGPTLKVYNVIVLTTQSTVPLAEFQIDYLPFIEYPASNFATGQAIDLLPTVVGLNAGQTLSCPSEYSYLPVGLTLNPENCAITGVATAALNGRSMSISPAVGDDLIWPANVSLAVHQINLVYPTTQIMSIVNQAPNQYSAIAVQAGQTVTIAPQITGTPDGQSLDCSAYFFNAIGTVPGQGLSGLPVPINPNTCAATVQLPQGNFAPGTILGYLQPMTQDPNAYGDPFFFSPFGGFQMIWIALEQGPLL